MSACHSCSKVIPVVDMTGFCAESLTMNNDAQVERADHEVGNLLYQLYLCQQNITGDGQVPYTTIQCHEMNAIWARHSLRDLMFRSMDSLIRTSWHKEQRKIAWIGNITSSRPDFQDQVHNWHPIRGLRNVHSLLELPEMKMTDDVWQ